MIENANLDRVWFDMAIPRDIGDMGLKKLKLTKKNRENRHLRQLHREGY